MISNCGEIKDGKLITHDSLIAEKNNNNENNLNKNEITIIYKKSNKEDKTRLFGDRLIKNNYSNCKIIIEGNE